ncbi:DUF2252 family protein [Hyalangium versicolor]|uniref:DUF2252 family protein n=1 Tax=Hyalangium versicolor TaxID=2861190 RepID=UPI001CCCFC4F|nr:DUF2252 family protein [Hyalangium versicolor]
MRLRPSLTPPARDARLRSAPAISPSERQRVPSGLQRAPEQAVNFIASFEARLDLPPERLREKETLMRENVSAFFRMMPALFHDDLRGPYASASQLLDRPAPRILVGGDTHIQNFGTLRGPDGSTVWGLNDFDQAGLGSPEADLTRLATSAVLMAREAGLSAKEQTELVSVLGKAYFGELDRLAEKGSSPGAFLTKKEAQGKVDDLIGEARDASSEKLLEKYVRLDEKEGPHFRKTDTLRPVPSSVRKDLKAALETYEAGLRGTQAVARPLKVLDQAQRLDAGGSSYGLGRYYVLVEAARPKDPPVLLELKELLAPSIAEPPVPANGSAAVDAQKQLGGFASPLTGATRMGGRAFLVREVEPEKAKLADDALNGKKELASAFEQAARVLARAHGATPQQVALLEKWVGDDAQQATRQLATFAQSYATQTQADWQAFRAKSPESP